MENNDSSSAESDILMSMTDLVPDESFNTIKVFRFKDEPTISPSARRESSLVPEQSKEARLGMFGSLKVEVPLQSDRFTAEQSRTADLLPPSGTLNRRRIISDDSSQLQRSPKC